MLLPVQDLIGGIVHYIIPFLVMITILIVRPGGLFGRVAPRKV